ncbi:MAG TPA: carbamate kinase [Devosia sp.]|nr:carbamate kinase [Devosia sp.]
MRIVVALGGNALLRRGEPLTAQNQRDNVREAAVALVQLIGAGHSLVITHGNGPQVGLLALQSAAGPVESAQPLDILGAQSEGMIGYLIEQELGSRLPEGHLLATLLTQTLVSAADPAFAQPTKPIGPVYDEGTAARLAAERGWRVARDGDNWRRVVASPEPLDILEIGVISLLVEQGVTVICAGGGGVPVIEQTDGSLIGIEAVVDKDFASALLARRLQADMLMLLTDVEAVYADFGTPSARALGQVTPQQLLGLAFPAGSMGPKVAAAIGFTLMTGQAAVIGRLADALAIVRGERGTTIRRA